MKISFKLLVTLLFFVQLTPTCKSQEISGVRYEFIPNSLLEMIEQFPEKEESIRNNIKSSSPLYVDFILIKNDLLQVYWNYQNNLMGIKVFSKDKTYSISSENELAVEEINVELDSIKFIRTEDKPIIGYDVIEKDAMPLTIILMDVLPIKDSNQLTNYNNYPEVEIITKFKIFPEQLVFGKPRPFMTFDKLEDAEFILPFNSVKEYEEFMQNIKSSEERSSIIEKITN